MSSELVVLTGGGGSPIGISSNGIDWEFSSDPFELWPPTDIIWDPSRSLFFASTYYNVWTSPDGITWTKILDTYESNLYVSLLDGAVSSEGVLIFAGGEGFVLFDGSVWSTASTPGMYWRGLVWSPELEIFVAYSSDTYGTSGHFGTSPDGKIWTTYPIDFPGEIYGSGLYGIAWSPELGLFVAVGQDGRSYPSTAFCFTSPDGAIWTEQEISTHTLSSIAWSSELGLFVAGGQHIVTTSSNGIIWTSCSGFDDQYIGDIAWSKTLSLFIMVGGDLSYKTIFTSPDGINWTSNVTDIPGISYVGVRTTAATPSPIFIHASTRSHGPIFNFAQIKVDASAKNHGPIFNLAPIKVDASAKTRHLKFNLAPITIEASGVSRQGGSLSAYTGEPNDILMSVQLTGRISPILPEPTPPVDFEGIPDPTVAPICVASSTQGGHLPSGVYRYAYAAWIGDVGQATAPSPWSEPVTLTIEDTVTLTYPIILEADGYLVYRREMT